VKGTDMAVKYAAKFDIITPTWFDIKPDTNQQGFSVKVYILIILFFSWMVQII
jgi:hypothetical protein